MHIPADKGAFHFIAEQPRIHLLQTPIILSKGVIQFSWTSLPWGSLLRDTCTADTLWISVLVLSLAKQQKQLDHSYNAFQFLNVQCWGMSNFFFSIVDLTHSQGQCQFQYRFLLQILHCKKALGWFCCCCCVSFRHKIQANKCK